MLKVLTCRVVQTLDSDFARFHGASTVCHIRFVICDILCDCRKATVPPALATRFGYHEYKAAASSYFCLLNTDAFNYVLGRPYPPIRKRCIDIL